MAAGILMAHGYQVKNLNGGYRMYQATFGPKEAGEDPSWD